MKHFIYSFLILTVIACGNENENNFVIEDNVDSKINENTIEGFSLSNYKWLEGKWRDTTSVKKEQTHEVWFYTEDSIFGNDFYVRNSVDTTNPNRSVIKLKNDKLYLINIAGEDRAEFRLTNFSKDSLLFKNPAHRYPQEVSYTKLNDNLFQIRLFGFVHQQNREIIFRMERYE